MRYLLFIKKGILFLKHYVLQDPSFVLRYVAVYPQPNYKANADFYPIETVLDLIKSGKSYIRLGDGEVALMKMRSIHFQNADISLREKLKELISEYTKESRYILAIPERYINRSNEELKKINLLHCWLPFKVAFRQYFPKNVLYADAHAFYIKSFFENRIVPLLRDKHLIIITNKNNIEAQRNNVEMYVSKNTLWIESPSHNSYDVFESIQSQIEERVQLLLSQNVLRSNIVIMVSTGPMGKVLAHALSKHDLQCLDIGHGFEKLYSMDLSLEQSLT